MPHQPRAPRYRRASIACIIQRSRGYRLCPGLLHMRLQLGHTRKRSGPLLPGAVSCGHGLGARCLAQVRLENGR